MTLSVLADFADIAAALAIVLSLIFVGYELHQNRTQAELVQLARASANPGRLQGVDP
jgi:hypothetical protein